MLPKDLKVGDKIRIIGYPGEFDPDYFLHEETRAVYKKLMKRKGPVRIAYIEDGIPWYKFRQKIDGQWAEECLAVLDGDNNWELVQSSEKVSA